MKERRTFLFNNALNTFYLQLSGTGHTVKDHSDIESGTLLLPLPGLLCQDKDPTERTAHTTAFDTPVVEHWLEQCIKQLHDQTFLQLINQSAKQKEEDYKYCNP